MASSEPTPAILPVPDALDAAARLWGHRVCLSGPRDEVGLTFNELLEQVRHRSRWVSEFAGPGQRVGLIGPSGPELSLWLLGIMWRHAVVPINPKFTLAEVLRHLDLTGTEVVITVGELAQLDPLRDEGKLTCVDAATWGPRGDTRPLGEPPKPEAPAAVLLTSGSSGTPKVVPLSHRNLVASAEDVISSVGLSPHDKVLVLWAQHHIGGLVDLLLAPLLSGCPIVNAGEYSREALAEGLKKHQPTWFQCVPTTLAETIRDAKDSELRLPQHPLRFVRCVAAPLDPEIWQSAEDAFGCPIVHTYGMTEAAPLVTSTAVTIAGRTLGSSGRPVRTHVRIVDDGGNILPPGEVGEITVSGSNVFSGYEGIDNQSSFTQEWFHTGDLGWLNDAGELFVNGRVTSQINRGGEKINPLEVERALVCLDHIREAYVFPVPHRRLGQVPVAAIVADSKPSADDTRNQLSQTLAPYKIPVDIVVVDDLPRTAVGKVDGARLISDYRASQSTSLSDARSDTEQVIHDIWCQELDQSNIPNTRAFVVAGGDSLSAVRVVAEIERVFELGSQSRPLMTLGTIEQMATYVDSVIRPRSVGIPGTPRAPRKLVNAFDNDLPVGTFVQLIADAQTDVQQLSQWQRALTHLTRDELREIVYQSSGLALSQWLSAGRRKLLMKPSASNWTRSAQGPFLTFYERYEQPSPSPVTVVGFAGNLLRLMLPLFQVLDHLPPEVGRLILVLDDRRNHYEKGVTGLAHDIGALAGAIRGHLPTVDREALRVLGASSGGLAALRVGWELHAASIGLVGPDRLSDHHILQTSLAKLSQETDPPGNLRVLYSQVARDAQGARQIAQLVPQAQLRRAWTRRHNSLNVAARRGLLSRQLRWLTGCDMRSS